MWRYNIGEVSQENQPRVGTVDQLTNGWLMIAWYIRPYTLAIKRKSAEIQWLINLVSAAAANMCIDQQCPPSVSWQVPFNRGKSPGEEVGNKVVQAVPIVNCTDTLPIFDSFPIHCRDSTVSWSINWQLTDDRSIHRPYSHWHSNQHPYKTQDPISVHWIAENSFVLQ